MLDHRILQRLHRQLRETHSFHVTRYYADRRKSVRRPRLEECILNVVADRPESSTRVVVYYVSVSHQTICRDEHRLHHFHFQRLQALNSALIFDCLWVVQQSKLQMDFIVPVLNSYCKHYPCQRRFQKAL
ncbi:hypothetical protein TNCV_4932211 [Trichonephila clavipes]|nr:hypothetical protein TNCV_4932211 [Trichonephila clavipes]